LESQVQRLAEFITEHVPGEPSHSEGAVDTAIRLLGQYFAIPAPLDVSKLVVSPDQAQMFADAIARATANPGRIVHVEGQA
jgi:hypothetical protein